MWGTYIRGAFALGFGALFSAMLAFVLATFIPVLQTGAEDVPDEAQADVVIGYFTSVSRWFGFVVLLSICVFVIGRAVLENRVGRRVR